MNTAMPRGTDNARVMQVIVTESLCGDGLSHETRCRLVRQYWDFDGTLLAVNDPLRDAAPVPTEPMP